MKFLRIPYKKIIQFYWFKNIHFVFFFILLWILANHQFVFSQVNWQRYESNPVLKVGSPGSWDEAYVGNVSVLAAQNKYMMWYEGANFLGERKIGLATSLDGIHWEKYEENPVLEPNSTNDWEDGCIGGAAVVFDGSGYKMWYNCYSENYKKNSIGFASSLDGIIWEKHHAPVILSGESSEWDSGEVKNPHVIYDGSLYHMWYQGCGGLKLYKIGYASSKNGTEWNKDSDNPIFSINQDYIEDGCISSPCVKYYGDNYHMWYIWKYQDQTKICFSYSQDGISWTHQEKNFVPYIGSEGTIEASVVDNPFVLFDGINYHLWYNKSCKKNDKSFVEIEYLSTQSTTTTEVQKELLVPDTYSLSQNFPNPFNPETRIQFSLPRSNHVSLTIYNTTGQEILKIIDGMYLIGSHTVHWDGRDKYGARVPSGVYFYKFLSEEFIEIKKMMLIW